MKRIIASVMVLAMALALVSSLALSASASTDYSVEFNFLETSTYESSVVYNSGMKPAGDSRSYGYKGWLGSKNATGANSVFLFDAGEGNAFVNLTLNYKGYSIAPGEPDSVRIYVSVVGEDNYEDGYVEDNWHLVASIINDATAGTGVNVADPTNRDPEVTRTVDVTPYVMGNQKAYVRIDFYRGDNLEGVASTYFALAGATGTLLYENASATEPETTEAPVVTEPETTEAPVVTEPETTEAPVTDAPTEAPEATDAPAPEATEAAPTTDAPAPEKKGCGGMIAGGVLIVAILGTAIVSKKRD